MHFFLSRDFNGTGRGSKNENQNVEMHFGQTDLTEKSISELLREIW